MKISIVVDGESIYELQMGNHPTENREHYFKQMDNMIDDLSKKLSDRIKEEVVKHFDERDRRIENNK